MFIIIFSKKKLFMEPTRQESAVYADEEGNIFIRAYVQTKSPRQAIFCKFYI